MTVVRFLDGQQAGHSTRVAADLTEGQHRFHGSTPTHDRRGTPYYLKPAPPTQWALPDEPEWTAALDTDPDDDV